MFKKFFLLSAMALIFFSCKEDKVTTSTPDVLIEKLVDSTEIIVVEPNNGDELNAILVEKIDSISFSKIKDSVRPPRKMLKKITDFKKVKKLLHGTVEFDDSEQYGEAPAVKTINFKNGTKFNDKNGFYEAYFVAYFPTEEILLCEGGHSTDVSFDLKNGKLTEDTGNPNEMVSSPKSTVRLSSHYGGQECSAYFIQKKKNKEFEKIIQLDDEFKKITGHWLCTVGEAFWADEKTLYVSETNNAGETQKLVTLYFKISLIKK